MPARNPRITTVVDPEVANWLRRKSEIESRSVSTLVREILTRYLEEEEERYWASEGEARLATFDEDEALTDDEVWD